MTFRSALLWSLVCGILSQGCDGRAGNVPDGSGGTSGSAGSGGVASSELHVVRTWPRDGEEGVAREVTVRAELDGALDSLGPFDLKLELQDEHGRQISGEVSLDRALNQVVFTPDEPFALELGYSATINRSFEGDEEAEHRWSFEARDGEWSEPASLGGACGSFVSKSRLAMAANGDAVAAWAVLRGGGHDYVCSQPFTPVAGWEAAYRHPEPGASSSVSNIAVAIDSSRNVVIASRQSIGDGPDLSADRHVGIYAATFDARQAEWETARRLDPLDLGTAPPEVVIDDAGQATVVWQSVDGDSIPIWVSRHSPGAGWSGAQTVIDNVWVARSPAIAVDARGEVLLTASQFCLFSRCIVTRSFSEGFGWTESLPINPNASTYSERPAIAVNSGGYAGVVWHQAESNSYPFAQRAPSDIWASILSPALGWTSPQLLEVEPGDISPPHVAIDELGNAIAVWGQYNEAWSGVYSSRFTQADGWSAAEAISEPHLGETRHVRIATDPTGKAIAVWQQSSTVQQVWANRFTPMRGWGEPERVDDGISLQVETEPQIAIDATGRALMVWSAGMVRARRFD